MKKKWKNEKRMKKIFHRLFHLTSCQRWQDYILQESCKIFSHSSKKVGTSLFQDLDFYAGIFAAMIEMWFPHSILSAKKATNGKF